MTLSPLLQKTAWIVLAVLSILIGLYPLLYFLVDMSAGLLSFKSSTLLANPVWNAGFYSHIIFGGITLLTGWVQFSKKLRDKNLKLHRRIGTVYVAAALISALSGIYVGIYATGGLISAAGFMSLGIIWFFTTLQAYRYARAADVVRHQKMMRFSYAACFGAVTLRLWMPFLIMATGDFVRAYQVVAWLCWVPNIAFVFFTQGNSKITAS